jgi:hypothetical protein
MADPTTLNDQSNLVTVLGRDGQWHVRLWTNGFPPVVLGPYQNPEVARTIAERLNGFIAAVRAADAAERGDLTLS